jgi:hypothetical protein
MKRWIPWTIGGVLVAATAGILVATAEQDQGSAFIPGDKPVTQEQVRQQMQALGWSNVQIVSNGRYFQAIGSKGGQSNLITVDSQTGRLQTEDDGDD